MPSALKNIFTLNNIENQYFALGNTNEEEDFLSKDFYFDNEVPFDEPFQKMSLSDEIMYYEQSLNNLNQEEIKIVDIDKISPPDYFSLRKIKDLLNEKLPPDAFRELNDNILQDEKILEVEASINNPIFLGQKKKRKEKKIKMNDSDQSIAKEKQKDITKGKHDKYCGDNSMKKIKLKLMESFLQFENNVINKINKIISKIKLIN